MARDVGRHQLPAARARVEGADGTKTHHRFGGRQEDLQDGGGVGHVVASKIWGLWGYGGDRLSYGDVYRYVYIYIWRCM